MSGREGESDSDAPEEFTYEQGIEQDKEITKVQRENKARVVREVKERRRKWAENLTPRPAKKERIVDVNDTETNHESLDTSGMLPDNIVEMLAAREKKVYLSDPEEEKIKKKSTSKKKRPKSSGLGAVILNEIPPAPCLQSSLDFLKKRSMQVSRSSAVLNNSNQALRLISNSGLLSKK